MRLSLQGLSMPLSSFCVSRTFTESSSSFLQRALVLGRRLSSRFVAGLEIADALRVAESINKRGMAVTLDSLGESVGTEQRRTRPPSLPPAPRLDSALKLNANISVKLTQMGLDSRRTG